MQCLEINKDNVIKSLQELIQKINNGDIFVKEFEIYKNKDKYLTITNGEIIITNLKVSIDCEVRG
jgi:hypothetical protein